MSNASGAATGSAATPAAAAQSAPVADSLAKRFAERHGLNRPMVRYAGMVLTVVLVWAMMSMNQRQAAKRNAALAQSDGSAVDTAALRTPAEGDEAERPAWNDPIEAARMAGDTVNTLPRDVQARLDTAAAGSDYVPVGSGGAVGPGGYGATVRGAATGEGEESQLGTAPAEGGDAAAAEPAERQLTPEEQRRAHYLEALTLRSLSVRRARRGRIIAESNGRDEEPHL